MCRFQCVHSVMHPSQYRRGKYQMLWLEPTWIRTANTIQHSKRRRWENCCWNLSYLPNSCEAWFSDSTMCRSLFCFFFCSKSTWAFMLQPGCYLEADLRKQPTIANVVFCYLDLHKQMLKARLQKKRDDEGSLWTVQWELLHKASASSWPWL